MLIEGCRLKIFCRGRDLEIREALNRCPRARIPDFVCGEMSCIGRLRQAHALALLERFLIVPSVPDGDFFEELTNIVFIPFP